MLSIASQQSAEQKSMKIEIFLSMITCCAVERRGRNPFWLNRRHRPRVAWSHFKVILPLSFAFYRCSLESKFEHHADVKELWPYEPDMVWLLNPEQNPSTHYAKLQTVQLIASIPCTGSSSLHTPSFLLSGKVRFGSSLLKRSIINVYYHSILVLILPLLFRQVGKSDSPVISSSSLTDNFLHYLKN